MPAPAPANDPTHHYMSAFRPAAWRLAALATGAVAMGAAGCADAGTVDPGTSTVTVDDNAPNPLLGSAANAGKEDSQYLNPDGIEVEVDVEADLDAPAYSKVTGPAILAQFAMTYLRKTKEVYLESLAEQASSKTRVEWKVDGNWVTAGDAAALDSAKLTHFRIRGIHAVLLHDARKGVAVGTVVPAPVPKKPFSIMTDAGETCGEAGGHIGLSQSVYWYLWEPEKTGCKAELQQTMSVTVSKMLPAKVTYPEYDQLAADGKITMVVLFGQIDDTLGPNETGVRAHKQMATWLASASFAEVTPAPVGRRFAKTVNGIVVEVDLYSPYDFSGLSDHGHFGNFQKALGEHEIVTYDGHSMLGASDFWARPTYPEFYQIFLYGGCLGYEYYVAPILAGKKGWEKLDVLSSVIEVSANANEYAGPFLAKLLYALEHGYNVSWKDILGAIRQRVGDSTFGMSGVRENCFSPGGSTCGAVPEPTTSHTYAATPPAGGIPDNSPAGYTSTLAVADAFTIGQLSVNVKITHSYIGDLTVVLEKDGVVATLWDRAGDGGFEIDQTTTVQAFAGQAAAGTWTLKVVDGAAQDVGVVDAWGLTMTAAP